MAELILGLRPANERRRYFVTKSLIGREQAKNQLCDGHEGRTYTWASIH